MIRPLVFPASVLILALSALGMATCGARLPKEVSLNRPTGSSMPVDLTKVNFVELTTGAEVNVADYMEAHNLQHMLLTFGSQSCSACMEKAHYLETNLVGHYELLGEGGNKFEVRGINTDKERSRPTVIQNMKTQGLTHIKWGDGSDEKSAMMEFFQPSGMPYSVPLTVMIDRKGIQWRIPSTESVSPEAIVNRIAATLGADAIPVASQKPTPSKPPVVWSALAEEKPGRLKALPINDCAGNALASAQDILGEAGLKFLVVDRGNCTDGSVCDQNRAVVQEFLTSCQSKTCKLMTIGQTVKTGDASCSKGVLAGGKELFDTFEDLFTWNYPVIYDDNLGTVFGKKLGDSLVFVFDHEGKIVFSKEGSVSKAELEARWSLDQFSNRHKGPAFDLYLKQGTKNFSDWRQQAKYSMVTFWDPMCSGCVDELDEWHHPGGMLEFCRTNPDFCQTLSVNPGYPEDNNPASVANYFNSVLVPYAQGRNWDLNLAMDMEPLPTGAVSHRWFDGGGVWARFADFQNRTLLYDREGKVLQSWVSKKGPEPLDALKKLLKEQ